MLASGLISGWALWIWLGVVAAVGLALVLVRRRPRSRGVPLAHTDALRQLPRYQVLLRRHRLLSAVLAAAIAAVALSAIVLTARPAASRSVAGERSNRDVMLCLDVSSSMHDVDAAVLRRFQAVVAGLRGQRIGLMIFDAGAVLKFPLTDDYDFARDQLVLGAKALADAGSVDWQTGTVPTGGAAGSWIGDGVVSCLGAFDHPAQKRSRSIVLATDAEPGPGSIYSTVRAGALAAQKGVHLYALSRVTPGHQDADYDAQGYADLASATKATRGAIYPATSTAAVPAVVGKILAQQASTSTTPPRQVHTDRPAPLIVLASIGTVALVVAAWRSYR